MDSAAPPRLVDLHCHILPALDDGALEMADSLAMARQAQHDGIAAVCATPHIRDDHDVRIDELPARISALQAELAAAAIPVHILAGAEVSQRAAERLDAPTLRRLALGAGRWLLLEPAPGPLADTVEPLLRTLSEHGLHTIIAHPERHLCPDFQARLAAIRGAGGLIQWTAEFLVRSGEDPAIRALAAAGMVDLLGSDAHSSHGGRPLRLSPAVRWLAQCLPARRVRWIAYEVPWAVLRGLPVRRPR